MENWQREDIAGKLRIVRYLLTQADTKGLTHGEKHYLSKLPCIFSMKRKDSLNRTALASPNVMKCRT